MMGEKITLAHLQLTAVNGGANRQITLKLVHTLAQSIFCFSGVILIEVIKCYKCLLCIIDVLIKNLGEVIAPQNE